MKLIRIPLRWSLVPSVICSALFIGGCSGSTWTSWIPTIPGLEPYRMDIQQGNAVTRDMVEKLKPGMTRAQVRFALGTPLIVDPFRKDRWDYVFYFEKPGEPREYRHIAVVFKDDRLERIDGDLGPPGAEGKELLSIDKAAAAAAAAAARTKTTAATSSGESASGAKGEQSSNDKATEPATEPAPEERGFFDRMFDWLGF